MLAGHTDQAVVGRVPHRQRRAQAALAAPDMEEFIGARQPSSVA
jgi:hypothetical protein